jgi:hypothetical protein
MSESDLLKRIAELETLNLELLAENEKFREMLGLPQKNITVTLQEAEASEQDNIDNYPLLKRLLMLICETTMRAEPG